MIGTEANSTVTFSLVASAECGDCTQKLESYRKKILKNGGMRKVDGAFGGSPTLNQTNTPKNANINKLIYLF